MNDTPFKQVLLAVALAGLTLHASAHRNWIMPSTTVAEGKEPWVVIDGVNSENLFELDDGALKLDGVAIIEPDGSRGVVPSISSGRLRSTFDLKLVKNGTYKIALVNTTVTASYKVGAEQRRFRGSEQAFAREVPANAEELRATILQARLETFVTANQASTGALKPSGSGLEMVPLTHPNDLRAGETARWRFQLDGQALPNFAFSLVPGGVRYRGVLGEIRLATDASGEASVSLPAAGMYWLNATHQPQPAQGPGAARRYSYAATLEILPQ
ncbi:MAG: DUF4198 domain-containing protein [Pseudomonadota bacterium]